ncbi:MULTISPECIES: TonB-dependent siderophore receptor [unclassified Sphingomonas]|uniref:TonB-dependent receptor n=1 Tax=Novosphingobium rhizosphaerae TaxID=1551649 RepID=UPI0015C991C7
MADDLQSASQSDIVVVGDLQAKVAEVGPLGLLDILSTPYSINSVTADTIELRQTRTLIELQKTDASAQFLFNGFGAPVIAIRGFTAEVRLDGARSQYSAQFPLEFVDRIDIIKGASSFLYGFAAPGGVVDYALKRPEGRAFVTATASYRSDTNLLGRVDVNQPITDTLGVRVNALYEGGETYLQDDAQRRIGVSGAADWRPTENLLLRADYTWQRNAPLSGGGATFTPQPGVALPEAPDPRRRYNQKWERLRVIVQSYGLRGDWTFAHDWTASLRARGFIQTRSYFSSGGLSLGPNGKIDNAEFAFNDGQNSFQQQAKINGLVRIGAAEHHLTLSVDRQFDPNATGTGFGFLPIDSGTLDNPIDIPRPANFGLPSDPKYRTSRTLQKAGTLADRIELGPWTALLAVRYVDFSQANFDPAGATTSTYDVNRFTPTIGLSRRIGSHASVYASYAQSLEQGATPPVSAANPAPTPLGPVGSDQFELGVKAQAAGFTATAAVFHLRRDYQGAATRADGVTPGFIDDGKQVHTGVEATLSGKVAPGWNVIAGVTWLDARIREAAGFALNGSTPDGVAKFQSTLFVEHEAAKGLFINAGLFHASGREIEVPNNRRIGGFTTVDAGIRWVGEVAAHKLSINANVENVLGERYWGGEYFGVLSLGVPRQFKLTISTGL